jgi:catalase
MTLAHPPVLYGDIVEHPSDDEAKAVTDLKQSFARILDTTSKDYGRAVRGVHAKGQGIVRGTLRVHDDLAADLAQGLFAAGGTYDAVMRFSTAPGDILDDAVSSPRGIGLKVFGVPGEKLTEVEQDGAQDFLMVNGPAFGAPTPAAFAKNLKLLAGTTDKAEGAKAALSATLRVIEGAIEALGGHSALISQLGGAPEVHPLGETYYSQSAFRFGDHVAKFALVPVSPGLTERTGDKVSVGGRPDALREDIREVIAEQGGTWDLRVQLCTDPDKMPIEDPTVVWDEKLSPYVSVAHFTVAPQIAWTPGTSEAQEDRLSFSPWHGLAAHRPLGAINRARREVYDFSADYRANFNHCPVHGVTKPGDLDL